MLREREGEMAGADRCIVGHVRGEDRKGRKMVGV